MIEKLSQAAKYIRSAGNYFKLGRPSFGDGSISQYRFYATQSQVFETGQKLHGFVVQEVRDIPEFQMKAIRFKHVKTGADYLHIDRQDSNNVFCIGFKTPPMSSNGVPHILEHTVLCGSAKYPCRDPFFKMINRSLSTFMNAFTGSDYTMYPFSTQNPKDFQNLMSVYLDATLRPNLKEMDFLQEGWRLEHKDLNDKKSPLIFKGVVYNEMKGVFTDPQMLFMRKLQNNLLPSHTYGYESGGDPLCIPSLTWKELKDFHAHHYHPSNSRFYTYGDLPITDHLDFIEENYLKDYVRNPSKRDVPEEPRWTTPRKLHVNSGSEPMSNPERQGSIALSFLLRDVNDYFEGFTLSIISELLIGGPNAPFYTSLLEPQIGTSFSPVAGYDNSTRSTTFTIGLQGLNENDFEKALMIINETFEKVVEEGFSNDRIEAVLHSIELGVKHQTSQFGLNLAIALNPLWNHGGNIFEAILINKNISEFRNKLKENPRFIQEKIEENFVKNQHKLILTMTPDKEYEMKQQKLEENLLREYTSKLSEKDIVNLWNIGHTLKKKQETKEDISCLPTLKISDIERHTPRIQLNHIKLSSNIPLQVCVQPTNAVSYFRAFISTHNIPPSLQKYVPLFSNILTKMGTAKFDFKELDQRAELVSGGLSSSIHLTQHPSDSSLYEQGILLSSHSLAKNFSSMLDLWTLVFNSVTFNDTARFSTLVKMIATDLSNSLVHGGHSYAMSYAAASTNFVSHLRDSWTGFTFLEEMKSISELADLNELIVNLRKLIAHILSERCMRISLNVSPETLDESISQLEAFIQSLQGNNMCENSLAPISNNFEPYTCKTHLKFPFPVNYASKAYPCVPYSHSDSGPLRVLARLMFQFLHREIREKGGAYGGGANFTPGEGFKFYSYRDPESVSTLKTFDDAVQWVVDGNFSQKDLDEAKLGVFQKVDAPIAPGSKGMREFLYHISQEKNDAHRISILDAKKDDLIRVASDYLHQAKIEGSCLIGPQNEQLDNDHSWKVIQH